MTDDSAFSRACELLDAAPAPRDAGPNEREVMAALSTVIDPEIGLDIVTLGMVFGVEIEGDAVRVTFTLTTPNCPMESIITAGIGNAVLAIPAVCEVTPQLVWSPAWHPGMIREGAW